MAAACAGRPTVLHHHDLPWQRPHLAHLPPPPDDAAWAHVTINELSRTELATHGIAATTIYNAFDPDPAPGERTGVRARPRRRRWHAPAAAADAALARKNIAGGLALAEALGATYWLLGPAEDGYGPELERLVADARCPVVLGTPAGGCSIADAYAACDVVGSPRSGRASATRPWSRRPTGALWLSARTRWRGSWRHSASAWFDVADPAPLAPWLRPTGRRLIEHNQHVAADHFNLADLPGRLSEVLRRVPGL